MKKYLFVITVSLCTVLSACSIPLGQSSSPSSSEAADYAARVAEYDLQTKKAAEQMAVTDQQQMRAETQLKRMEAQSKQLDALHTRWEQQADRYDAVLTRWEKEGRGK